MMKFLPSTIINFHAVYDSIWMEKTLLLLKQLYNMVSAKEIKDYYYSDKDLKSACLITFDDGDLSFYNVVFPLLKKHNIPASIYVSPKATVNGDNFWFQEIKGYNEKVFTDVLLNLLSKSTIVENISSSSIKSLIKNLPIYVIWEAIRIYQTKTGEKPKGRTNLNRKQLLELNSSDLVEIGAHTQNHPILMNESDTVVEKEIIESINELSFLLNKEIEFFAYPNGVPNLDFSQREIDILKKTSVKIAFSTEKKKISKSDNKYSVPRNGITRGNRAFIAAKLIAGENWYTCKQLIKGKQEIDLRKTSILRKIKG